ncbi:hypothetical protein BABINDRAFT_126289 [Babjeviella inositovora NRRL Y-12698]|uniref:Ubiquitin-like domain-containing protein n=1 Tax=Babjeviella inositovora NRRL Y-12698 TaxID=984486 RepID=A0A1E3QSN2_9ASCO|nr:uncharacterized protein BABINDRAFT_126289 [Babjeviella inositovora NRRL Y-12698]ODQ80713.1 hypothetical protein BABINDRAFT_126289 [Babjeviella inositovora NRRL Y-12698]
MPQPDPLIIVIRFSDGIPDLQIPVPASQTVTTTGIRRNIRSERNPETGLKRLRLLYNGRMLTGRTNFAREVFKYIPPPPPSDNAGSTPEPYLLYVHCLIGDDLTAAEIADEDKLDQLQQETQDSSHTGVVPPPSGFDRLRDAGFSQEDIDELRSQFRAIYGGSDGGEEAEDGQNRETLRQLEDEWIDATVHTDGTDDFNNIVGRMNTTRSAGSGTGNTNRDLLVGLMMGCFFGVLCLILMKDTSLWSKKIRMAMCAGMIVNFSFGLTRSWY